MIINTMGGGGKIKHANYMNVVDAYFNSTKTGGYSRFTIDVCPLIYKDNIWLIYGASAANNSTYRYFDGTGFLTASSTDTPTAFKFYTRQFGDCEYGGNYYIVGGTTSGSTSPYFYKYDGTTWTQLASPPTLSGCYNSESTNIVGYNNKIYAFFQGDTSPYWMHVYLYDISSNTWTANVATPSAKFNSGDYQPIVYNGLIWMGVNTASSGTTYRLYTMNPSTYAFTNKAAFPGSSVLALFISDGKLCGFGNGPSADPDSTSVSPGVWEFTGSSWTRITPSTYTNFKFTGRRSSWVNEAGQLFINFGVTASSTEYYAGTHRVWPTIGEY